MTLYALRLAIRYEFDRPSGAGRQLFRILPADILGVQKLRHAVVTLSPNAPDRYEFKDFFGTKVIEAAIPPGLTELKVELQAKVMRFAPEPRLYVTPKLQAMPAELAQLRKVAPNAPHHFLPISPRITPDAAIAAFARDVAHQMQGCSLLQLIEAVGQALYKTMEFDPKATDVDTAPALAFAQKRGVCQDFAQIMIAALRALGVPAAYVSGYLRTKPPAGKPRLQGADAMHAWVRAWLGVETGWVDYDPTNGCFAGADHIDIGFGRDYGDVAPIIGMLRLEGRQSGHHFVDLEEIKSETAPPLHVGLN